MNKDERSAASTGADTERHRSNDLNPTSAPALSLPIQRLGSAMEGRILPNPGSPEASAMLDSLLAEYQWPANSKNAARAGWEAANRWLRQRPGAQAASEPITVATLARASDRKALGIMRGLNVFGANVTLNQPLDLALIGAALSHAGCSLDVATPAGERPAQAEPMTDEQVLHLWDAHVGDPTENYLLTDKDKIAFARAILASPSARERPGAQAPSTAAADVLANGLTRAETEATASVFGLTAPSTGGAETAAVEVAPPNSLPDWDECRRVIENAEFRRRAKAGLEGPVLDLPPTSPEPTELHRFIYEYDDASRIGSGWFMHRLERLVNELRAASAPAQAVETAGVREASCWLVEKRRDGRTVGYLGHACGSFDWMPTPGKATRFARREDANGVAECFELDDVIVAEHIWHDAALQSPAASPASKEQQCSD